MDALDQFAPFYDLEYGDYTADIDMYRQFAAWCAPAGHDSARVLELACGTGRVLLALAEDGHDCTGIDASAAMLEIARRHAAERGVEVRFVQGRIEDAAAVPDPGSY